MAVTIQGDTEHELRAALGEIVRQNGQTAVILQRLSDHVDELQTWRKQQEDDKRKREDRLWQHREGMPLAWRDWLVLGIAAAAFLANWLPHFRWVP